jgi:hypothetical protein
MLFISCGQDKKVPGIDDEITFVQESPDPEKKIRQIFYSMYLPDEMSRLFERVGANYNPSILNSPENFAKYTSSSDIALNLGIYGVDMSYSRMFEQTGATAKYFSSIQLLSEKLGIPRSYFEEIFEGMEEHFSDKDSLLKIAGKIFDTTDRYLKDHRFDAQAALIVAGGWVEALYIATRIYYDNPENIEIADRIAEQKYSLNSLISLLGNYQSDLKVAEYVLMLKRLRVTYEQFDFYYSTEDLQLDTITKTISATEYDSDVSPAMLSEISVIISDIRSDIVN